MQFDKEKVDMLLDGFKDLEMSNIDQVCGMIYIRSIARQAGCRACVGAWVAYCLEDTGGYVNYLYTQGIAMLSCLFKLDSRGLAFRKLLEKHGAPMFPFSAEPWTRHPYLVLRDAIEERFGYVHGEDPIPVDIAHFQSVQTEESMLELEMA